MCTDLRAGLELALRYADIIVGAPQFAAAERRVRINSLYDPESRMKVHCVLFCLPGVCSCRTQCHFTTPVLQSLQQLSAGSKVTH